MQTTHQDPPLVGVQEVVLMEVHRQLILLLRNLWYPQLGHLMYLHLQPRTVRVISPLTRASVMYQLPVTSI